MHIKTGWTPRDYLDLYVTDDGETFDLVQGGQAGNNDALAFNRILANCKTIADTYNKIFGTAWSYGFTPFTVESIYSAANLQLIEGRCWGTRSGVWTGLQRQNLGGRGCR